MGYRTEMAKRICQENNMHGDPTEFGTDECFVDDSLSNLSDLGKVLLEYVAPTKNIELITDFVNEYYHSWVKAETLVYINYLKKWIKEHSSPEFEGMKPSCIEEYLENDLKEELGSKVYVYCYDELKKYSSRKKAIEFYSTACNYCDPESHEFARYATILYQLKNKALVASDEWGSM